MKLRSIILAYLALSTILFVVCLVFQWFPKSLFLIISATIGSGIFWLLIIIAAVHIVLFVIALVIQIIIWLVTGDWDREPYNPYR
jgi:hypothetical protein